MRSIWIIVVVGAGAAVLLLSPILNLHGGVSWGWLFSPRVEKEAIFEIYGAPFVEDSWPARWGKNRPPEDQPHWIISEVEVKIRHETRPGFVRVEVTGDSEADVDSVIASMASDFKRTYEGFETPDSEYSTQRGTFYSVSDEPVGATYWRQRYYWLLMANVVGFGIIAILLRRTTAAKTEQNAGPHIGAASVDN